MRGLFDDLPPPPPRILSKSDWVPPEPPSLDNIPEIELDCETTGLRWWANDRPIGFAISTPAGTSYLPWGHYGGGNLDENTVYRWAQRELRNKHITNLNLRFDLHMLRSWGQKTGSGGLDLEEQGCTFSDVGHQAALLDDHRQQYSLEALVKEFLPDEAKVKTTTDGIQIDASKMAHYHAGTIAVRAEADARQVTKLKQVFAPRLAEEDLLRVLDLENKVLPVVIEMERNGTKIDLELLDRWIKLSHLEIDRLSKELEKAAGFKINPRSPDSLTLLFQKNNLPYSFTPSGNPSFTDLVLKKIDHPLIKAVRRLRKTADIQSDLETYQKSVDQTTGILRYSLHQLRAQKEEGTSYGTGTISGRFSSTKITKTEGTNIQAVLKHGKQRISFGYDEDDASHDDEIFLIRKLHVPEHGEFLSADAMQIEYRLAAAEAKNPKVIAAYQEDPFLSFHKLVHSMLLPYKPDLTYRRCKDVNFGRLYGAGLRKLALMLEFISQDQFEDLNNDRNWKNSPLLDQIKEIDKIYNQELPEAQQLLSKASKIAEEKGFIRTILGRRSRFPDKKRLHKSLNARVQGSAADIMKTKLCELHAERKTTGFTLRYTVHDEVDGDIPDQAHARLVQRILNRQSFKLAVPILWEVSTGENWGQTVKNEPEFEAVHDTEKKTGGYGRVKQENPGFGNSPLPS